MEGCAVGCGFIGSWIKGCSTESSAGEGPVAGVAAIFSFLIAAGAGVEGSGGGGGGAEDTAGGRVFFGVGGFGISFAWSSLNLISSWARSVSIRTRSSSCNVCWRSLIWA